MYFQATHGNFISKLCITGKERMRIAKKFENVILYLLCIIFTLHIYSEDLVTLDTRAINNTSLQVVTPPQLADPDDINSITPSHLVNLTPPRLTDPNNVPHRLEPIAVGPVTGGVLRYNVVIFRLKSLCLDSNI